MSEKIDRSLLSVGIDNHDLCTRCGTCIGACPAAALVPGKSFFPELLEEKCTECGLCGAVCPGGRVSYHELSKIVFNREETDLSFDGHVQLSYVGFTADEKIKVPIR